MIQNLLGGVHVHVHRSQPHFFIGAKTKHCVSCIPSLRASPQHQDDTPTAENEQNDGTAGREHGGDRDPSPPPPPPHRAKATSDPHDVTGGEALRRQRPCRGKTTTANNNNNKNCRSSSKSGLKHSGHNDNQKPSSQHQHQHQHRGEKDPVRRGSISSSIIKRKKTSKPQKNVRGGIARPRSKQPEPDEADNVSFAEATRMVTGVGDQSPPGEKRPPREEFRIEVRDRGRAGGYNAQRQKGGGCAAFGASYDRQRFRCDREGGRGAAPKRFAVWCLVCVLFLIGVGKDLLFFLGGGGVLGFTRRL